MTFLKPLTALAALAAFATTAQAATVKVTVNGVEARPGTLYVGLQTEDQFMQDQGDFGALLEAPTAGTHTLQIDGVPAGRYSVSVLHDEDGDQGMALTKDYRPAEGWAMLNGEDLKAAPTFEQTSFELTEDGIAVSVTMVDYPAE